MCTPTEYSQQAEGLVVENEFQLALLQLTDAFTSIREISKGCTVAGSVVSVASLFFSFDHRTVLTMTAISGVTWGVSHICASKLESHAKEIIRHFSHQPQMSGK